MSYTTTLDTAPQPTLTLLQRIGLEADLTCMMCGRTVGHVIGGKARQHAGCAGRLRIERGVLRCCHCNGQVYRDELGALE